MPDVIHLVPNSLAALRFVQPLTLALWHEGVGAEIWLEKGLHESVANRLSHSYKWHEFSLGLNPLKMVGALFRLWTSFARSKPKAVQAHFTRSALIPLLAARLAGVPVRIYHNHGIPYLGYKGFLKFALKWLERTNIWLATHVLTVSPAMRDAYLCDHLLSPSKCTVLGPGSACGLSLNEYDHSEKPEWRAQNKERIGIGAEQFVVLYVGRPHRRKGFDCVLSTWARHFAHEGRMNLVLAGCDLSDVKKVLGESVPDNLRALGFIDDLRPWYGVADVVVLPSEHEGFGYALLEGAASGCCLIASDIPGPDAILKNGVNGFSISPGDEADLARRIEQLHADDALRLSMSLAARVSAMQFDRKLVVAQYVEFMHAVLNGQKV